MDDDKQQFISITGATAIEAQFYLDSSKGDLQAAMNTFFAQNEYGGRKEVVKRQQEQAEQNQGRASTYKPKLSTNDGPRIATLGSRPEKKSKGTNEYYAGGEKSGQVVRANDDDDDDDDEEDENLDDPDIPRGNNAVDRLLRSAHRHGAERVEAPRGEEPSTGLQAFSGTGRTLAGSSTVAGRAGAPQQGTPSCVITFYRNQLFTVNNGPARGMTDAENQQFLAKLFKGELPSELEEEYGREAEVDLVRKDEDYKEPEEPKYIAFQGSGRRMDEGQSSSMAGAAAPPAESLGGAWQGADNSKPTTTVQIRLHDGQRLVAQFNLDQTISDIRMFLATARPDLSQAYQLMQAYPPQPLTDDTQTIEQAGLKNAAVSVRLA